MEREIKQNKHSKYLKTEREKHKESINVYVRSRLCNMPSALLGTTYRWVIRVCSEVDNVTTWHISIQTLEPVIVIVNCKTSYVTSSALLFFSYFYSYLLL
jgi:hypothetical protein